ncbi:MAG: hypothetical protein BGO01_11135 [Armatimonadetes bacterium 55-13]|nr:MAG: hypothetical protein ABT09_03835 [bacterium SCN 57-13]OJU63791.1 MAG: hypothetical protein BGO01_11135 [Armatimonadetes bacterium 55-13]
MYRFAFQATWISHALVAGTFFAFSAFVMAALSRMDPAMAARMMNSINVAIVRSPFIPLFLFSAVMSVVLPIWAWRVEGRLSVGLAISGASYLLGILVVTATLNVPMNDRLAASDSAQLAQAWASYAGPWTAWNHVRTLAGILSILGLSLTAKG